MDLKKMNLVELDVQEMKTVEGGGLWSWIKKHIFGWVDTVPDQNGMPSPAGGVGVGITF